MMTKKKYRSESKNKIDIKFFFVSLASSLALSSDIVQQCIVCMNWSHRKLVQRSAVNFLCTRIPDYYQAVHTFYKLQRVSFC